ncbi:potassium/proton antiporter, CPA1 family [Fontimonas thermophila]|uniref:Potassium/proton antiporter, CPA1 family n=1 Tax=Fontimonas thermophila TaxID=1076937 RepID=A0A1I2JZS9_9GAMM|nr:potassium/proton antiporter [Fontimonas thermophila]SFF58246.1 potassium/proton antiporter, CPA1 family [Fontimonas thermophila]
MEFVNQLIFLAALLFLVSILASTITPRLGVPLLLVFLVIGMLAGEDGPGGIQFENYALANLAATAGLAVVLFDGGLRTPIENFRVALRPALSLATVGVLLTAAITGVAAARLLGLSLAEGFLIGAIVASTDAAAVFSLLRTQSVSLNQRVGSTLEIESGSNDPMAVFLTLALIGYLQAPDSFGIGDALAMLAQQGVLGALLGLGGGKLLVYAINRLPLSDSLYPLLALFGGMLIFGATALVGGSGFLAVYLAGLFIGNRELRAAASIRRFHDGIAWMAQIGMFVILGLLVSPNELLPLAIPGLLLSLVLILIARPVSVFVSLLPFRFPLREQVYIAWVGLRGSVPIVLATFPWLAGLEHAPLFFNAAFFIVLVSLIVQGSTVAWAARLLGLQVPATSARIHRVDLDLPGQTGFEVVSYRIARNSALIGLRPRDLPLPALVRVLGVSRAGTMLDHRAWGQLQAGDYISLLTPQRQLPALDRLFETAQEPAASRFFGEFVIDAEASLEALCQIYDLPLPPDAQGRSVGALLRQHLPHPVIGDRLRLGELELIVRAVDGDQPTRIGLRLPR